MQFDKTTIVAGMKMAMAPVEKAKTAQINLSIALCLDDISMKLQSIGMMTSYDVTIAADTRTVTIDGSGSDMRNLYALKYGTGNDQKVLIYVEPRQFMAKYDNPSQAAGTPAYFTILESSEGYPVVKFDVPALSATTMTVYYFMDYHEGNMGYGRSAVAIVAGSLAWFWGIADGGKGQNYYERYKELLASMRAADTFLPKETSMFTMSKADRDIRGVIRTIVQGRN